MRHRKKFNHLSRTSSHRNAMLSNMATSLILHKRITTTTAKAKALRSYVEPLITRSKEDTTHSRRMVFSYLQSKDAVNELFREVSTKIMERPGGYTRIIKMGNRLGDNADMCLIELVDYNENMLAETLAGAEKKTTGRKRRRRGSGSSGDKTEATPVAEKTAPVKDKEVPPPVVEDEDIEPVGKVEAGVEEDQVKPEEPVEQEPAAETKPAEPETEEKAEEPVAKKETGETPEEEKPEPEAKKAGEEEKNPDNEAEKKA